MSDFGDPYGAAAGGGQPSEEQVQQMLAQMRVLPVDQHLAQVLQMLLEGAQVKIGRNDGRLLLDTAALVADHVRPHADPELLTQVDDALAQLRTAQVQAEQELQRAAVEQGHAEANDLVGRPQAPGAPAPTPTDGDDVDGGAAAPRTPPPPATPPAPGSKLWVPGR